MAAAAIQAAWSSVCLATHPRPPRPDPLPHEAVGQILASNALARLQPDGRVIAIARAPQPFR